MSRLFAYVRTLVQYWHDPKGRHDICDYGGAVLWIVVTMLVATGLLWFMMD